MGTGILASGGMLFALSSIGVMGLAFALIAASGLLALSYKTRELKIAESNGANTELLINSTDLLKKENELLQQKHDDLKVQFNDLQLIITNYSERGNELLEKIQSVHYALMRENERYQTLNQTQARLLAMNVFLHFDENSDHVLTNEELENVIHVIGDDALVNQELQHATSVDIHQLIKIMVNAHTSKQRTP